MTIEEQHNGDLWGDRRLFCTPLVVVTQSYTHDTSHRTVLQKGVRKNTIVKKRRCRASSSRMASFCSLHRPQLSLKAPLNGLEKGTISYVECSLCQGPSSGTWRTG